MTFEIIWKRHQPELLSFIKTGTRDKAMIHDILQEVGIKLYLALKEQQPIRNYQTWLFQVAKNTMVDFYRQEQKRSYLKADISAEDADYEIVNPDINDLLGFIIQTYLPQEYGTPLYLGDIEEIPQKIVGHILNLSLPATKSRIQRARKKLKEVLMDFFEIQQNDKGEVLDFQIKTGVILPKELLQEMKRLNFFG
ncbi:MAG TPA: hypothetical protein DCS93_01730 [Microscillaceae bacterium]|nr:hypothetical protein [Microscillaceae bacterium]